MKKGYWLKDRHGDEYRKQADSIVNALVIVFTEHDVPECEIVEIKELHNLNLNAEATFLQSCGFDVSNGFWQQDVDHWKAKKPFLYERYVVNSQIK